MFSKSLKAITRQIHDYKQAFSAFSHNAGKFLASGALQGIGGGMLATVFGIYLKSAGMNESIIGTVEGAVALTAAIVCLVGPPLVAAVGYRALMVAAIGLTVFSRLGQAMWPIAGVVVGLALTFGLGDGFMRAIGSAFMSENSDDEERTHLFSAEFIVRVVSGFIGGLAGGLLPAFLQRFTTEVASYQYTLSAATIIVALGILPMLKMREKRQDPKSVRDAYIDSVKHFSSWRHTAKLVGPQLFISMGGGLVIPFIPLYLKHQLGVDIASIGIIQGLASVVLGFTVFGTPVIARKFGLVKGVALMQALSVPFLALVPFAGSMIVAVLLLWGRSAVMNTAGPMYNQFSMEGVPEKDKPIVAGLMFFCLNLMWMVGSMLGGKLMVTTGYTAPYSIAVGLYLAGAVLTYVTWRNHGKNTAQPEAAMPQLAPEAA